LTFQERFSLNFIEKGRYKYLLSGINNTLLITIIAAAIGIALGFLIAIIRSTHDTTGRLKILDFLCKIYLTVIRGTPTTVQLLIVYFVIFSSVSRPMLSAFIAFGLNSAAYVAEIVRSGIMSIDPGQMEAGRSLGLTYPQTMAFVIIPQAFKNVLPALANEFIVLLKETSICIAISLRDLTYGTQLISSQTYDYMFPLLAGALIYLVIVVFLTWLFGKLERSMRKNER